MADDDSWLNGETGYLPTLDTFIPLHLCTFTPLHLYTFVPLRQTSYTQIKLKPKF
jgi:hypothetical protein